VDKATMRRRVGEARVGYLVTVTPTGRPHVVPCCFALLGDAIYSAVDAKPKSTLALRRLANLAANGRAALLVDHYEEDWSALWWVRVDGRGWVLQDEDPDRRRAALAALAAKYEQYRRDPPPGPVVAIDALSWHAWP